MRQLVYTIFTNNNRVLGAKQKILGAKQKIGKMSKFSKYYDHGVSEHVQRASWKEINRLHIGFGHQFVSKSYPLMVVKSNLYPPSLKLFYLFLGI